MARLLDDIRGGKLRMPFCVDTDREQEWEEHAQKLFVHTMLKEESLPVLLIDNVAEYYFSSDQEFWDLTKDFPNLAPPYPAFWAEHRLPRRIWSKEKGETDIASLTHGRVGIFTTALERHQWTAENVPENVKWVLWCEIFIDYSEHGWAAQGPHGSMFIAIDAEGRIVSTPWMQSFGGPPDIISGLMTWLHPVLLAISFLHCKNVTVVDNPVPPKLAKKFRARHNGMQPVAHKTLIIEPLKQILRHEGRSGQVGLARAMHICRGHFKDYREGRGLFGKYHQLVWQPMLVRGAKGKEPPPREAEIRI